MMKLKSGKAFGPDEISVEVWRYLGERAMGFFNRLFKV